MGATAAASTAVGAGRERDVEPDSQWLGILEQQHMDSGLIRQLGGLTEKVVIVVGGATGLGAATARRSTQKMHASGEPVTAVAGTLGAGRATVCRVLAEEAGSCDTSRRRAWTRRR